MAYIDTAAIIQVIGAIFMNNDLLDNNNYTFNEEDFPEEFHKILFGTIYNLHQLGNLKVTIPAIEDYLSQRPKSYGIYKNNKGAEYLAELEKHTQIASFDYYYKRMKKMTLFRMYESIGLNLSWLYDTDNIFDTKKKQAQEDWLDNTPIESIAEIIDNKIIDIRLKYVDEADQESINAGTGAVDLLNRLKTTPDVGYPLFGDLFTTVTGGARLKKFYLRSASTGVGKAIPNDTLIPTPLGWRKVGDIQVGDYLFGQDGVPTKVLKIFPQPEKKEIWEVEFSDGRIAKCCKDHLWEYRYEGHREKSYRVESIEQLYNRTLKLKNGLKDSSNKGYRFHIKLNEEVHYPEKQYKIHPYVMGALLGDGSFRYDNTNKALTFSAKTDELPNKIAKLLGDNIVAHKSSDYNYNYTFKPLDDLKHNLWVEEVLDIYPELWNLKSEDKFIPKEYLEGSVEQRFELLRGLMDTDGSIEKEKGRTIFTTISKQLRDNIIELTRSLGMISTVTLDDREDKYTTGECYKINIQCKKQIKPLLFSLQYKVDIANNYANSKKREEAKDHLAIVDIRQTEEKVDMTCFTVDNENHLFLMNDFIVTHNTRSMIADACYIACDELYNSEEGKWIKNGTQEPTIYISTEQEIDEIQTMMLAFISDVNEEHILNGEYLDGEWERVLHAADILNRCPLFIQQLPDFSLKDIENTLKRGIHDHGVKYLFFDYLHSSMKILSEVTSKTGIKGLREDNVLFMISIRLKDMCNQYGVFIMTATQLNSKKK